MDRRSLIGLGIAGATAGLLLPKTAHAHTAAQRVDSSSMAGGIFLTAKHPGRWEGKAGSHAPIVTKIDGGVRVFTKHPMSKEHWIVKHILLDAKFQFLDDKRFDPSKDSEAVSEYKLEHSGTIVALSVCNKHDTWVTVFEG